MRPDGESAGQPTASAIEEAARAAGLAFHHLPARPGAVTPELAGQLKQIIAGAGGPVLGFCASGNRCAMAYDMGRML